MSAVIIAPSVLSANFADLGGACELINKSDADWLHVDVMDGRFVPNISFGFPVLKTLQAHSQKPLDVHLMIVEPDKYLETFVMGGATNLTVHYEACPHLHRTLEQIRGLGAMPGVAINPSTPVSMLEDVLGLAGMVVLMGVNPGFGGQRFIENTYRKLEKLTELRSRNRLQFLIEIDGGVDAKTAPRLISNGADVLVAGNAVFGAADPLRAIHDFKMLTPPRMVA